jgi:hypothetical protein
MPQVCACPAAIIENVPAGGVLWPEALSPRHTTVPPAWTDPRGA